MRLPSRAASLCLGVIAVCALPACVITVSDGDWHLGDLRGNWSHKAERSETRELDLAASGLLEVAVGAGEVRVRSSASDKPGLIAHITSYGKTDEEAAANLALAKLDVERTDGGVRVSGRVEGEKLYVQPRFDLELVVPAKCRLGIQTGSGAIAASGEGFGDSRLESSYGSIAIDRVDGDLSAVSSSGKIDVDGVRGKRCDVRSGYGALAIADVETDTLSAKTSSGSIRASKIRAQTSTLDSGYGSLDLTDVDGQLDAKSSSGRIHASKLRGGSYKLASNYGTVTVVDARGDVSARSSSGQIDLSQVEGAVDASTNYGGVKIDGVLRGVIARTSSGAVALAAREGSVLDSDWKIESNYGRIECELPSDLGFELAAKTGYGDIDVGYEIAVAPGGMKSGKQLAGKVNGGGHRFEVATSSGNIVLRPRAR